MLRTFAAVYVFVGIRTGCLATSLLVIVMVCSPPLPIAVALALALALALACCILFQLLNKQVSLFSINQRGAARGLLTLVAIISFFDP